MIMEIGEFTKTTYTNRDIIDTVYDDLTIGMIARKNNFEYFYSKLFLGSELPKENFVDLTLRKKDNIIQKNVAFWTERKREENVKICTLTHTQ